MKKVFLISIAILFFSLGALLFYFTHFVKSSVDTIIVPNKFRDVPVDAIERRFLDKTPFNLLLIGYGGVNHDGGYLTDSIMVAHIDPKLKITTLISIPRDTWVKIPTNHDEGSYSKINFAYWAGLDDESFPNKKKEFTGPSGGGNMVKRVVGEVLGLSIDNYVGMDFSGFQKTIDSLDGVDIDVEKTFDDYSYPITGKEDDPCGHSEGEIASLSAQLASPSASIGELDAFPCRYEHLHFDKGKQHMEGQTALKYVRSRHSLQDGTDFGRAKRQRNLLTAVKEKVFSANLIPRIIPFMESLKDNIRTDLTLKDIEILLKHAYEIKSYKINTLALTDDNFLEDAIWTDGQSILQPKAGVDNWDEVHKWIRSPQNSTDSPKLKR